MSESSVNLLLTIILALVLVIPYWLLDEYEKGNKFFLYTGRGPSGPVHVGHLGTWMFTKWLQDAFDVELWFQFTDDEKFWFNKKPMDEIQKWTDENRIKSFAK